MEPEQPREPTKPSAPADFRSGRLPQGLRPLPLGQIVITPGALRVLPENEVHAALQRHALGDWGTVGEADWKENDLSVDQGFRVLSAYQTKAGTKFWIITEADRSSTCILLPEEY